MSNTIPKIRCHRGNVGNELWIHLPDLSLFETTFLSGNEAANQTVLSSLSGTSFSAGDYVLIGDAGSEQTEIALVSSSTATSITISSGTSHAHTQGTKITFIPFNQIEIYSSATSGGTFALLATVAIRSDALETFYVATTDAITVYYKARFKNVNDTEYSDYSDEVLATGFAYNTVYSIKKRALEQLGEKIGGIITDEFLNDSLWECRREFDRQFKRWSFRTSFNTDIANLTEGQYSISVPSTLRQPDSPENILGLRIGNRGRNLTYIDKKTFDHYYEMIFHTTVGTQPSIGDVTIVLDNVRDLDASGSIVIGSNTITYTAKVNATGTLTGVPASGDGSITVAHAVGVDAWQNASFGEAIQFTMFEDTIYFNCPFDSDFEGTNMIMDYYRTMPEYNSDADVLDEPNVDMFVSNLKYMIKSKKEKGNIKIETDSDYQNYMVRRSNEIKKEMLHQGISFSPDIGHLINVD